MSCPLPLDLHQRLPAGFPPPPFPALRRRRPCAPWARHVGRSVLPDGGGAPKRAQHDGSNNSLSSLSGARILEWWWQWRILNGEGRQEGGGTEARMLVGLRPMPPATGAAPSLLHLSLTLLLNSLLILTFLASFLLLPACPSDESLVFLQVCRLPGSMSFLVNHS
jgi:hypothetical protein